jgi:NAD(P)-dependent dehydrogenase (short-subunit alcohol dehydrogenase family)
VTEGRFGGVLVATGGTSGIAAATSRRFAAEGGQGPVADLDGDRARALSAELDGSSTLAASIQERIAEPQEIAGTACLLLSAEASSFTGALLVADGSATVV